MSDQLTENQIRELVTAMPSCRNVWHGIALVEFGIKRQVIEDLLYEHREDRDSEEVCRKLIQMWASQPDNQQGQVKKLAKLLYESTGNPHVNADEVERILRVKRSEVLPLPEINPLSPEIPTPPAGHGHVAVEAPVPSNDEERELSTAILLKLSKFYHMDEDIYSLTLIGLEMNENVVEGHLRNKRDDIHSAVFQILRDWRKTQEDAKTAYENLCKALRHKDVNTPAYIKQALQ